MPQRRPPQYPLPQGLVWRHFEADMAADQPLAEWAYQTPSNRLGLPASTLSSLPQADQDEVVRSWFLANYEPLGPGPWLAWDTPGAGWDSGAKWAPETWPASAIIDDEFGSLLPDDVRASLAAELHVRSTAWQLIPGQVSSAVLDVSQATIADLPSIAEELLARLERVERLLQAGDEARHGIGGNRGPALVEGSNSSCRGKTGPQGRRCRRTKGNCGVVRAQSRTPRCSRRGKARDRKILGSSGDSRRSGCSRLGAQRDAPHHSVVGAVDCPGAGD